MIPLTSTQNPWIRQLRQLQQAKGRREQAAFLVEGSHLLQEALVTGWPLLAVCFTEAWVTKHPDLWQGIPAEVRQQRVSESVLKQIATTETPDGVVAIAQRAEESTSLVPGSLGLIMETLQDPGNLGTLIRVAAATAADGLWLSPDSVDPDHPKVLRASAGQWFRRPPQVADSLLDWVEQLNANGIQTLAAVMDPEAELHWQLDLQQPTVFVLGNEGSGLSQNLLAACSRGVRIPMAAGVESLNVAMTGGILLYEAIRQRQTPTSPTLCSSGPTPTSSTTAVTGISGI